LLGAGLSFLGLGVAPPTSDWGLMLSTLRQSIYAQPIICALPGAAIFICSMSFNLLSDGLRSGDGYQSLEGRMPAEAMPQLDDLAGLAAADPRDRGGKAQPLLTVENLSKSFPVKGGVLNRTAAAIKAVDDVSFVVRKARRWHRRRIRMRKVHAGAAYHGTHAARRRPDDLRR